MLLIITIILICTNKFLMLKLRDTAEKRWVWYVRIYVLSIILSKQMVQYIFCFLVDHHHLTIQHKHTPRSFSMIQSEISSVISPLAS